MTRVAPADQMVNSTRTGTILAVLALILDIPATVFWMLVIGVLVYAIATDGFLGFGAELPSPLAGAIVALYVLPAISLALGFAAARNKSNKVLSWSAVTLSSVLLLLILAAAVLFRHVLG